MIDTVIKADNVTKSYGNLKAVKNLSFQVEKSACFGMLGPNGAGKTTMSRMLYGNALRDNSGKSAINVFGYDPGYNELQIKALAGIVPQENNLDLELSVEQNLFIYSRFYGLRKREISKRIDELLNFMELTEKKKSKIRDLSGGMKRRLIIARALINRPKLLILDEPTTGLDPQVRNLIWDKLRKLQREGVTIILTTHYMEEAFQLCTRLIIMNLGEKILEGRPAQLLKKHIEPYVLEIFNQEKPVTFHDNRNIRIEGTESRYLLYSNELETLKRIVTDYNPGDVYIRQSNLEDLFLKTTGRHLNE